MKEPIPGFDRYWLEVRQADLNTPMEMSWIVNLLELKPGARIFDAGCGPGRITNALAHEGFDVIGVDISEELIEIAQSDPSGAQFFVGDYLDTPAELETVNAVLSWHTSWGYDTHERNVAFFARCHDILKPGGRLLLQAWNPLGISERSANIHMAGDGSMICEVLEFDPARLIISIDRAIIGPTGAHRKQAECQTYTFLEIHRLALEAGFDEVAPISIPLDHPWQLLIATKAVAQ